MNVGGTLLGEKITKRYPLRGDLQLVRLGAAAPFTCSRCGKAKTASLVAVQGNALLCNGCYGRSVAELQSYDDIPLGRPDQSSLGSAPSSAEREVEPLASGVEDVTRIRVEEPDGGLPYSVVDTGLTLQWKFHVRAEHLLNGTCPVPAEMARRASQASLDITFVHVARHHSRALAEQQRAKLRRHGKQPLLTGISWQSAVLPGTRVSARWDRWKKLRFAYTSLGRPVVFAGTMVRYAYDPRIMTRDLAAFGAQVDGVEELVLITLRELGYLDERGRALLPHQALIRNTIERGVPERPPTKEIRGAIERLLLRRILTWEQGSLGRGGMLHYPTRRGEKPVQLLCYEPTLRVAEREDLAAADGHGMHSASAHRVAGHLMRIGHLGKEASAEARAAYRHDHQRAGLAGSHELPRGYTYVREHERGT
ncbi:hypothetical protein [Streptomyces coeruleorubidus]|uniref:hypothetical protein n=1 Tax=Streptomyces coeruleorubidus TaxID=116188 RepID=UPI00367F8451